MKTFMNAFPCFLFSEYLFDTKNIFAYNCDRKEEFIKKGIGELSLQNAV
jgi:hypothetical protein